MNNKEKGNMGESLARQELLKKGYTIRETNYQSRFGEIDIIAQKETYVVFVEVKLRKNVLNGFPKEAVTSSKQKKIIKTALKYIYFKNLENYDYRFDVIEIIYGERIMINHIENAFWL